MLTDEWLVASRAGLVDRARQQFLARPALADDQHAGIGARDHVRLGQLLFHERAARDDVGAPFVRVSLKPEIFSARWIWSSSSCLSTGLVRKPKAPICVACTASGNGAVRGQQDHLEARPADLQFLQQADAVHRLHAKVGDDEVGTKTARGRQRLRGALHRFDFVVLGAEADREEAQQARVVVDDQDSRLALD